VREDRPTYMQAGVAKWYATWGKGTADTSPHPLASVAASGQADW